MSITQYIPEMFDLIKKQFYNTLITLSEYQLPTLRYLGSTLEEIAKARAEGKSWIAPYCRIAPRESHLFSNEIKRFQDYVKKYPKYSEDAVSHNYSSDDDYKKYIQFIKKTAVLCNGNCGYDVCPFCNSCRVDHDKDNCADEIWDAVKKHHYTWRYYFMDKDETLNKHEWAIWHSYRDPIRTALWAKQCPCHEILYDTGRNENFMIEMLKFYDSRMLDLNVKLINETINK